MTTDTPTESSMTTDTPEAAVEVTVGPGGDTSFAPSEVTISAGETVRWVWDSDFHNVRPDSMPSGASWSGTPGGDSTTYDAGYTYSHTFEVTGEYTYYCSPHRSLGMTGTVVVE